MAISWPTPGFKGRTFKLCVINRWDFHFCVRSFPQRDLTVYLPLRKFHSADETRVWRDLWDLYTCLQPVSDYEWICFALKRMVVTQTCMRRLCGTGPVENVVIFTVNLCGTLTSSELNRWNMIVERPWWGGGILSLFKTCFRSPKTGTKACGVLVWISFGKW